MNSTNKLKKLFIEEYNYGGWYENGESCDNEESEMQPLEGDEKKGKWLKLLTSNKLLTRLPILLAKIKVENNSYKLKKRS